MQRRFLKTILLLFIFSIAGHAGAGQNSAGNPEKRQLKAHQKTARRLLTAEAKNVNKVLKNTRISSAQRAQLKHQMKRDKRELRRRQKDELQDLKDRQRMTAERSKHN
jgi:hypothetical protein